MNVGVNNYDYKFGIDSEAIDYVKESIEIASRVSPVKCYLLQLNEEGEAVGDVDDKILISSYSETLPQYRSIIWVSGSNHPDLRIYPEDITQGVQVYQNNVLMSRVLEIEDLYSDNEYAVVERIDLTTRQVEIVFNSGFNPTLHTIEYYYTTAEEKLRVIDSQTGITPQESIFGWTQYLNFTPLPLRNLHQILVRMPLVKRDLIVNPEGRVRLEDNQSWMVWEPYVRDGDVLVVSSEESISGGEERYEIIDKQDSKIQGELITQRFRLSLLSQSDKRYGISYRKT